jgi:hypothetical protein
LNIIYSGKKMLERCCKGAHSSVKNYFKAFPNVRIYADQKVVDTDQDCLVTDKVRTFISRPISATMFPDPIQECLSNLTIRQGDRIPTDVAYCCVGFVPNTDFMKANFAELLTPKGHIKVNEHLQVKQNRFPSLTLKVHDALALCDQLCRFNTEQTVDYPNIFALGDIADINEEKLAQVRCSSSSASGGTATREVFSF